MSTANTRKAAIAVEVRAHRSDTMPSLTLPQAQEVVEVADRVLEPTQVRQPWRATLRTVFAVLVAVAAMLPLLVETSGLDETLPPVAGALAIAGAVTRVLALPQVEDFLERFAPWLAAKPKA